MCSRFLYEFSAHLQHLPYEPTFRYGPGRITSMLEGISVARLATAVRRTTMHPAAPLTSDGGLLAGATTSGRGPARGRSVHRFDKAHGVVLQNYDGPRPP